MKHTRATTRQRLLLFHSRYNRIHLSLTCIQSFLHCSCPRCCDIHSFQCLYNIFHAGPFLWIGMPTWSDQSFEFNRNRIWFDFKSFALFCTCLHSECWIDIFVRYLLCRNLPKIDRIWEHIDFLCIMFTGIHFWCLIVYCIFWGVHNVKNETIFRS